MKPISFFICILALQINYANAQVGKIIDRTDKNLSINQPLVFVDSFQTDLNYLVLSPDKIESMNVYKDAAAIAKYGEVGKNGVIIIQPKQDVVFFNLKTILDNHNIKGQSRNFKICINQRLVHNPRLILIEQSELDNMEIILENKLQNQFGSGSVEKYINIVTKSKDNKDISKSF